MSGDYKAEELLEEGQSLPGGQTWVGGPHRLGIPLGEADVKVAR